MLTPRPPTLQGGTAAASAASASVATTTPAAAEAAAVEYPSALTTLTSRPVRMALLLTYLAFNVYVVGFRSGSLGGTPDGLVMASRLHHDGLLIASWGPCDLYSPPLSSRNLCGSSLCSQPTWPLPHSQLRHPRPLHSPGEVSFSADSADNQLIASALAEPASLNTLFFVIFNALGVLPAVNLALLLPGSRGQKPLPTAPFVGASFALGFGVRAVESPLIVQELSLTTMQQTAANSSKQSEAIMMHLKQSELDAIRSSLDHHGAIMSPLQHPYFHPPILPALFTTDLPPRPRSQAVGPYLALRQPRPEPIARSQLGFFSRYVTESKVGECSLLMHLLIAVDRG